jgi:hypothetical protein
MDEIVKLRQANLELDRKNVRLVEAIRIAAKKAGIYDGYSPVNTDQLVQMANEIGENYQVLEGNHEALKDTAYSLVMQVGELFNKDFGKWDEGYSPVAYAVDYFDNSDPKIIILTPAEVQSGADRVKWAEGLIKQLPEDHNGRNRWLMNYGTEK